MPDRQGEAVVDEARSLAAKLLAFKQTLDPHERALFAAILLQVQRDGDDGDVQGFNLGEESPARDVLATILPTPYPGDPELSRALGRA